MNKTDLVHQIHKNLDTKVPLKTIDQVVDSLLDAITESLRQGEDVQLGDFGTLSLTKFAVKPADKFLAKK